MREYLALLKSSALFDGLEEEELLAALRQMGARRRSFGRGEYIFRAGQKLSETALLLEGSVYICQEDYWGNGNILKEICPGELFGESYALPDGGAMLIDAKAMEDSAVLFFDLYGFITSREDGGQLHRRLLGNYLSILAAKNRALAQKLGHMSQRTTREKLRSYLSEQSVKAGSDAFTIPFNRQQLADYLAVDRSAMSGELCRMRDEGILAFRRNHFVLK